MKAFGGMISLRLKGGTQAVHHLLTHTRLFSLAESLGGVESLITFPAVQTHADMNEEIRERLGIHDRLLRLSVGLENAEDLIGDLGAALSL